MIGAFFVKRTGSLAFTEDVNTGAGISYSAEIQIDDSILTGIELDYIRVRKEMTVGSAFIGEFQTAATGDRVRLSEDGLEFWHGTGYTNIQPYGNALIIGGDITEDPHYLNYMDLTATGQWSLREITISPPLTNVLFKYSFADYKLYFGDDVTLYRSAANVLITDDALHAAAGYFQVDANGKITKMWNRNVDDTAAEDGYLMYDYSENKFIWSTGAGGTASAIAVADEVSDTTCFPLFVTAATGNLAVKTNTGLAFNSATALLTVTGLTVTNTITGSISGNAATVTAAADSTNAARYVFFGTAASGSLPLKTNEYLKFNPASGILTAYEIAVTTGVTVTGLLSANGQFKISTAHGGVTGALYYSSGLKYYNGLTVEEFAFAGQTMYIGTTSVAINRGSGALTLTGITSIDGNAATVTAASDSTNAARYVFFGTAASGSLPLKTNEYLKFNPASGILTAYEIAVTTGVTVTGLLSANGQFKISTAHGGVTGALYYSSGLKYYNGLTVEEFAFAGQTMYIGTTSVAINRGSGALVLTGITSIDGNAATVTNGVYTNANNSLSGNNTLTGALMFDGEVEISPTENANQSVSGKNTLIINPVDPGITITLTSPTEAQLLFVSNDKDSGYDVIVTPVRNGSNSSLTLASGNSKLLRYRSSETTWYAA